MICIYDEFFRRIRKCKNKFLKWTTKGIETLKNVNFYHFSCPFFITFALYTLIMTTVGVNMISTHSEFVRKIQKCKKIPQIDNLGANTLKMVNFRLPCMEAPPSGSYSAEIISKMDCTENFGYSMSYICKCFDAPK